MASLNEAFQVIKVWVMNLVLFISIWLPFLNVYLYVIKQRLSLVHRYLIIITYIHKRSALEASRSGENTNSIHHLASKHLCFTSLMPLSNSFIIVSFSQNASNM